MISITNNIMTIGQSVIPIIIQRTRPFSLGEGISPAISQKVSNHSMMIVLFALQLTNIVGMGNKPFVDHSHFPGKPMDLHSYVSL